MIHPQVFGKKFTPIGRFSAWKTHPLWPHIPNMTQYGSAPPGRHIMLFCKSQGASGPITHDLHEYDFDDVNRN